MTDASASSLTPFAWVVKRDGRLVPFDADKISRSLFAAGEDLGQPNAFLARELTDGILYFLATDPQAAPPTTAQIAEVVAKVVRELGHPALARAFGEAQARKAARPAGATRPGPTDTELAPSATRPGTQLATDAAALARTGPSLQQVTRWVESGLSPAVLAWRAAGGCLREYALREVFTRDLAAAQADGPLTLTGLENPLELAGCVLPVPLPSGSDILKAVAEARSVAGGFVALDSPEYEFARLGQGTETAAGFVQTLRTALELTYLHAVVNLHTAAPPPALEQRAVGPLFPDPPPDYTSEPAPGLADALLDACLAGGPGEGSLRVDWHLGPGDFEPRGAGRLAGLARRALEGGPLAFVLDRPRRAVALAEGLSRQHPAVLLAVALHLPWLVGQLGPNPDPAAFVKKLGSLARLALSAASQKRDFLRRHGQARPALTRGFLLERARLVVVPVGLDAVAQAITGHSLCTGGASLEFGRQVIGRLRDVLRQDGQAYLLEAGVDSPLPTVAGHAGEPGAAEQAAGLSAWDGMASVKNQMRTAGLLHAAAEAGTALVLLPGERPGTPEDVVGWLRYAWQQTDLVRVRFLRDTPAPRQLRASWSEPA